MKHTAVLLLGAGALLAGLASCLFCTTAGSLLVARLAIAQYAKPERLAIQRAAGSFSAGLGLRGVRLDGLGRGRESSSLSIRQLDVSPVSIPHARSLRVEMRDVRLEPAAMARELSVERIDGELTGDLAFSGVLLQDLARFPPGSMVKIERLSAAFPLRLERIKTIQNGTLRLPDADPILFYGTQQDGRVEAHVYAHSVDLDPLLRMVSNHPRVGSVAIALADAHVVITGSVKDMTVAGDFELSRFWREGVSISGCRAKLALTAEDVTTARTVRGAVMISGGTLIARHTTMAIQQGHVNFTGDPTAPTFDVKGVSKIGDTTIFITLKGRLDKPELQLSSEPPKPASLLLVMLATGRSWKGAQEALVQGTIPLDLAADFIDYFAFGGRGSTLARRFGLTGLAVQVDTQANTVGVETTVADRLSIGVEMQPAALAKSTASTSEPLAQAPAAPMKVGAEYKISDDTSLRLEGERSPIPLRSETGASDQDSQTGTGPQTDDQVLFKVKKRF